MGFQDKKDNRPPFKKPAPLLQAKDKVSHIYDANDAGVITHFDGRLAYVSFSGRKAIPCIVEELVPIQAKKADELEDMGMEWSAADERKWMRP